MIRHYLYVKSYFYYDMPKLKEGDLLKLVPDSNNEYDPEAVAIYKGRKKVGYVPEVFVESIAHALQAGRRLAAIVDEPYNSDNDCPPIVEVLDEEAMESLGLNY
ncbi:MAG: HIRAN domain-containing protein [Atopobiaceae bacterium]|jgi:hypothetical protein|nr:HIRAN domain-containing protein [Atopobiaceae bacterium]MCH4119091.1 HIRAN domain-containing protein [Atopobiaceae bacterium]MCI1318175.1 HIRAN domain-containing protein [Atopobiaceae bacterium]MCI1388650.1 HIRAN domain-containing protein [Atopobiaceae bacterium]MCI1432149.1 HIRAN domain-containing protein [Atopobiaceae bacterium]